MKPTCKHGTNQAHSCADCHFGISFRGWVWIGILFLDASILVAAFFALSWLIDNWPNWLHWMGW